jgi:hypothetical protein
VSWRKSHPHVPPDATAAEIYTLVSGAYAADRLGFPDRRFKAELRRAAPRFITRDYLGFDAAREPPPANAPDRYDMWSDALITTYFGDAYGIRLGASYRDVVQWLPHLIKSRAGISEFFWFSQAFPSGDVWPSLDNPSVNFLPLSRDGRCQS